MTAPDPAAEARALARRKVVKARDDHQDATWAAANAEVVRDLCAAEVAEAERTLGWARNNLGAAHLELAEAVAAAADAHEDYRLAVLAELTVEGAS